MHLRVANFERPYATPFIVLRVQPLSIDATVDLHDISDALKVVVRFRIPALLALNVIYGFHSLFLRVLQSSSV
jgi:hypothetical protein